MENLVNISIVNIAGAAISHTDEYADSRGSFYRAYCENELAGIIGNRKICQVNISATKNKGTIRGLHYQLPPDHEMKLVRCIKGKVWDVIVDLREGSTTFLKWFATELDAEKKQMMIVPEGCAHGFQVLEDGSELLYLHTAFYNPKNEEGLRFDEPLVDIKWPLMVGDMSDRDKNHPLLKDTFTGYRV